MAGTKSNKLEDQAATAALYVTKAQRKDKPDAKFPLDSDNKLSSASAATSLKYAKPRDLPSFPISGLEHGEAGAGAAASLANANHRDFEIWKPAASEPASKAAMLAKDYKPAPLWHPEHSEAGSKAADIAAKDGGHVDIWLPESTAAGNSAAGQAMRTKGLSPQVFRGSTVDDNKKALMAATGAMLGNRRRAGSTPTAPPTYPDAANSAANALKAATSVSRSAGKAKQTNAPMPSSSSINAARIHDAAVTNLSREMYTANPPVAPEVEEKRKQEGLRAAAVSMAKQMYDIQQRAFDNAANDGKGDSHYAANSVHNRQPSAASDDIRAVPQYVNLQEAAQKLAAERLAKLHDEHAAYRNYYGATPPVQKRLSIRARPRRRASSDGSTPKADEERSMAIRNQMSLFKDELAQVDAKKRQKDRDALMAAAQRNVKASMTGIDERVFNETGKASPAMTEEWETKAKARAKADSDARMVNHGRVNIGGGKYLDQSEVDAIAAGRVQPTLDEITEKAEKQRARDEELRQQQLERERIAAEKVADQKERDSKTKEEWKRFRGEEKAEAKAKKEEEKTKKAEDKRFREEEKRKSKGPPAVDMGGEERPTTSSEPPVLDPIPSVEPIDAEDDELQRPQLRTTVTEEIKIQVEEEKRASMLAEPPTTMEADDKRVSTSYTGAFNASDIAERVLSSPVGDSSDGGATKPPASTATALEPTATTQPMATKPAPMATKEAAPAATTETTVTGPSSSQRQVKGEGKVSSWLKNKLRRSSKPGKPETSKPSASEAVGSEKSFVGGASLTNPISASSDPSKDGFTREVATVGKPDTVDTLAAASATSKSPTTPATAPSGMVSAIHNDDEELYAASTKEDRKQRSRSSSPVSSLSSDEGEHPRGRSQLRREITGSEGNGEDEFEEAKDHFETERLSPPAPLKDTVGRASDSPVRDSKFSEAL
ncbi:MAG: hypothetical protein Q9168_001876 [Polycauliona sp. 1 TL-2023]